MMLTHRWVNRALSRILQNMLPEASKKYCPLNRPSIRERSSTLHAHARNTLYSRIPGQSRSPGPALHSPLDNPNTSLSFIRNSFTSAKQLSVKSVHRDFAYVFEDLLSRNDRFIAGTCTDTGEESQSSIQSQVPQVSMSMSDVDNIEKVGYVIEVKRILWTCSRHQNLHVRSSAGESSSGGFKILFTTLVL